VQDRARDLQRSIDGDGADSIGDAFRDERRQRGVVHLVRLEVADVLDEQLDMDADGLEAAHVLRLRQVALRAVGEGRAPMRSARQLQVDVLHLRLQALLCLFLGDRAHAHADANAAVALVDEEPAISAERHAGSAGRSHEWLL
jgi:hypothetical protein